MNLTAYALCAPALLVMLLTVIALLNDLTRQHWAPRWHVRRAALVLAGAGTVMLLVSPFAQWAPYWLPIALVALVWGVATALLTHPGMPPWHELFGFIRGKREQEGPAIPREVHERWLAAANGTTPKDVAAEIERQFGPRRS